MDIVKPIGSIAGPVVSTALKILHLVNKVKANKKQCCRVGERVRALERLVSSIASMEAGKHSEDVKNALEELSTILNSAFGLIEKFTLTNWITRLCKTGSHAGEFQLLNDRLNDIYQRLSLALNLQQESELCQLLERAFQWDEDEKDRKQDGEELNRMLCEYKDYVEAMQRDLEDVKNNVAEIMNTLNKPKIVMDIRIIKESELHIPKSTSNKTDQGPQVYKGEFKGFPVAAKIYTNLNTKPQKIKSEFQKEVQTMKQFESPNILRMFGICILEEKSLNPQYIIIMEYCEKGSLQEVLSSRSDLSWTMKVRMCLDAAQALYRLHQTEQGSKLHTNISSQNFFVDQSYGVKLGGLELAKTETSLRNASAHKRKEKAISSLCYSSPQVLRDIHHYCKKCEIYSLGIVMWEIATRRKPFSAVSVEDSLFKKVAEEEYQEPLPPECPEPLEELINASRASEETQRPSAGMVTDKLRCLLVDLEKE